MYVLFVGSEPYESEAGSLKRRMANAPLWSNADCSSNSGMVNPSSADVAENIDRFKNDDGALLVGNRDFRQQQAKTMPVTCRDERATLQAHVTPHEPTARTNGQDLYIMTKESLTVWSKLLTAPFQSLTRILCRDLICRQPHSDHGA
jgi:hypothetical protein